jgi:hypothetical protein
LRRVTSRDRRPLFVAVRIGKSPLLVAKLTQKPSPGNQGRRGKFWGTWAFTLPLGSTGQASLRRKRPGTWQKEPSLRGGFVGLGTLPNRAMAAIPAPRACVECMRPASQAGGARTAEPRAVLPRTAAQAARPSVQLPGLRGPAPPASCNSHRASSCRHGPGSRGAKLLETCPASARTAWAGWAG